MRVSRESKSRNKGTAFHSTMFHEMYKTPVGEMCDFKTLVLLTQSQIAKAKSLQMFKFD